MSSYSNPLTAFVRAQAAVLLSGGMSTQQPFPAACHACLVLHTKYQKPCLVTANPNFDFLLVFPLVWFVLLESQLGCYCSCCHAAASNAWPGPPTICISWNPLGPTLMLPVGIEFRCIWPWMSKPGGMHCKADAAMCRC